MTSSSFDLWAASRSLVVILIAEGWLCGQNNVTTSQVILCASPHKTQIEELV